MWREKPFIDFLSQRERERMKRNSFWSEQKHNNKGMKHKRRQRKKWVSEEERD